MYKKEIEAYIDSHRQQMLDDIGLLCRINSEKSSYQAGKPYGEGPSRALALALSRAERYGFGIRNYDNYVGTADLNDKEPQLDILAHLDVVPAGEGWTVTGPFEPLEKDGKIYGRGTADDKGPAVAVLYAMRAVKELGIPLSKNVRLIMGTDEECGSSDIAHYYDTEPEAPMTFSPDGEFPVVNIEKGALPGHFTASFAPSQELPRVISIHAGTKINVVPGKAYAVFEGLDDNLIREVGMTVTEETGVSFEIKGMNNTLEITAIGQGAHASTPQEGKNAITALLLLIKKLPFAACEQIAALHNLEALFPWNDTSGRALGIAMADELSGDLTLAFDLLEVTEDSLDGSFDSRCPICSNEENVLIPTKKKMAEAGFTLENKSMRPSHHVSGDSDFVKTLLKAYETYTGKKGSCLSMGGGTYVHDLKNGVAFGASMPGTDNKMHGADEFAVIDELLTSAKIFAQVIADLCK
ncbi:MAG: Sapep family Mn(2+)-dependent dipeptidase [Clostridium sp.]